MESTNKRQSLIHWHRWTLAGLLLLVAYVASAWPAMSLQWESYLPWKTYRAYEPLLFAWERFLPDCELPLPLKIVRLCSRLDRHVSDLSDE